MTNTPDSILQAISRSKTRAMSITELTRALGADRATVKTTIAQLVQAGTIIRQLDWSADRIVQRWSVVRTTKETAS